jgi:hypothetical protein
MFYSSQPFRWRVWLAVLPLATGVGLVVYILAGISLWLGVGVSMLAGIGAAYIIWCGASPNIRSTIKRRALVGIVAGLVATLAYDLSRYLLVTAFHFTFWPFDIFPIFGRLLVGKQSSRIVLATIGWLYHLTNGTGFGVAFMFLFRKPNLLTGLLWAAILEFCMVTLYPSWLGLKAVNEFLGVSVVGHVAYGAVLGLTASRGTRYFAVKMD